MTQSIQSLFNEITEKLHPVYDDSEANSITRLLLEDFGMSRAQMLAGLTVPNFDRDLLDVFIKRLLKHEPVQHVLGYAYFMNRKYKVNRSVLIPRQETEELVDWILTRSGQQKLTILDIGTGSGIIPISLKLDRPAWIVHGWDVSAEALELAAINARQLGSEVSFKKEDILKPEYSREKFDLIVSNPPYIRDLEKSAMASNVLDYDPHLALFVPDEKPLLFYEAIVTFALDHLNPGGHLYFEINEQFGKEVSELLQEKGFTSIELRQDLNGKDRMIKGMLS
ncbi:MAG: peptide chain release factor N(5)-glutamine methyltransferase [Cyclobacteriaceae bacterium]|nr:peptide chain release factor N(5)-glutamine methyltransferase [Cyclobacteriaceae bacterium HetDA_MAG_MS6]